MAEGGPVGLGKESGGGGGEKGGGLTVPPSCLSCWMRIENLSRGRPELSVPPGAALFICGGTIRQHRQQSALPCARECVSV